MKQGPPKVLIGPVSPDPTESVSTVNRAFACGLSGRFSFLLQDTQRHHGATRQSHLNFWNLFYFVKQTKNWVECLIRQRPDIAHYAVSAGWAMEKSLALLTIARWCGARTVGHLHSGSFIEHWEALPAWRRRIADRQLRGLDAMVVLSEGWRDRLTEKIGLPGTSVRVVNNPLDPEFERQALRLPIERDTPRILSLGTMGRDKGVFELVEACGILQRAGTSFRLDVVGPEREPGVKARVLREVRHQACEGSVFLSELTFGDAKLKLFREASIFVLASHYENFPLVALEAAAAGHALISTPVGAIPEFFQDGTSALFVPVGEPRKLAECIAFLLDNPAERRRLASGARLVFESRLKRSSILTSLQSVYCSILEM